MTAVGPEQVRDWVSGAVRGLAAARDVLDAANVFPVADADTGTNMFLTLRDAERAVPAGADRSAGDLLDAVARGAVEAARGNSGIILAEFLRGFAVAAAGSTTAPGWAAGSGGGPPVAVGSGAGALDGPRLGGALDAGARAAAAAVAEPMPGTILTAARAAADAALSAALVAPAGPLRPVQAGRPVGAAGVARAARAAAVAAVARSADELEALARAGVFDAGASGFVVVLDALVGALTGEYAPPPRTLAIPAGPAAGCRTSGRLDPGATTTPPGFGVEPEVEFEVMFALAGRPGHGRSAGAGHAADPAGRLRTALAGAGTSVAVVGAPSASGGTWQAHVHCDDPSAALAAAGAAVGASGLRPADVRVRRLAGPVGRPSDLGVVAVTTSSARAAEVARAGAVVLVADGRPSPAAVARAVQDAGRAQVVVIESALVDLDAGDAEPGRAEHAEPGRAEHAEPGPGSEAAMVTGVVVELVRGVAEEHLAAAVRALLATAAAEPEPVAGRAGGAR